MPDMSEGDDALTGQTEPRCGGDPCGCGLCPDQEPVPTLEDVRGDVHHLVNPIIGWLRSSQSRSNLTAVERDALDRLPAVIAVVDAAAASDAAARAALASKHGLGYGWAGAPEGGSDAR